MTARLFQVVTSGMYMLPVGGVAEGSMDPFQVWWALGLSRFGMLGMPGLLGLSGASVVFGPTRTFHLHSCDCCLFVCLLCLSGRDIGYRT